MERAIKQMLKWRGAVLALFLGGTILCGVLTTMVGINYDLVDYLPDEAPSTIALDVMNESYDKAVPNVRVMVRDVSIPQALSYKEEIAAVDGVEDVIWLDDQVKITTKTAMPFFQ